MKNITKIKFGVIGLCLVALLASLFGLFDTHAAGFGLAATSPVALTEREITEFKSVLGDMKEGWADIKKLPELVRSLDRENEKLQSELRTLRRMQLSGGAKIELRAGQVVSDACAEHLAAVVICGAHRLGRLDTLENSKRDALLDRSKNILGALQRSALTTSDVPLPIEFGNEVVELVWKFGQARQYGTVYPLGTGSVKLPRLKTSPAFGLIAQSAAVTEKSPQIEFVTFDAKKWGGLVRVPSEIDADSIAGFGQWLANYSARELAKIEDVVYWIADGSGTYASLKGATKAALDLGKKVTLAATKTKPSDITITNLRDLRAQVSSAALSNAAYYMNKTMESLLVSFNTSATVVPYVMNTADGSARLDGYPIRWVDVLPVYDTSAHASQLQLLFGDAKYHYLGARPGMLIATSNDVFFDTDEIAVRALERFTTGLMADDSLAVLQLAAS